MQNGTIAQESVTRLLERLAFQVNRAVHTADVEAVHDLRTSVRRFAQSLYLFKSLFPGKELRKLRRRLKELMESTNAVRDCDVALNLLQKRVLPGTSAIQQAIRARRKEAVRVLVPALRRWGARDFSAKWRATLTSNGGGAASVETAIHDRYPRLVKRLIKDGTRAESADDLHQLRIDGKKVRYSIEILQPVMNGRMTSALEHITAMQSLLGGVNDCRAVRKLVAEVGGDADIEAWLKRRQRRKTRDFTDQWPVIEHELRAALLKLRTPARKPVARSGRATSPMVMHA